MILAGKDARYIRHRVLPIMYKPEVEEKPKIDLTGETNPWKDLANKKQKFQTKLELPSWVKHTNISSSEESELDEDDSIDDSCCVGTIGFTKKGEAYVKQMPDKKCPGYLSFVETIKQAIDFNRASFKNTESIFGITNTSSDSESDSMYSDSKYSDSNSNNTNIVKNIQNSNTLSQNSDKKFTGTFSGSWAHKNNNTSPSGSISGETEICESLKNSSISSSEKYNNYSSKFSCKSSKLSFSSKLSKSHSFSAHSTSSSLTNTNKHVILSLATGYDRNSLREVRQIVNDKTGVALLPVGLGDRGMIGLGGYYIKRLDDIKKLEDQIVTRLTHLV